MLTVSWFALALTDLTSSPFRPKRSNSAARHQRIPHRKKRMTVRINKTIDTHSEHDWTQSSKEKPQYDLGPRDPAKQTTPVRVTAQKNSCIVFLTFEGKTTERKCVHLSVHNSGHEIIPSLFSISCYTQLFSFNLQRLASRTCHPTVFAFASSCFYPFTHPKWAGIVLAVSLDVLPVYISDISYTKQAY